MSLKTYQKKRNFKKTPEPKGKISYAFTQKKLFIVQKHAASHLHYDLRLELNGVLLSWAVPKGPSLDPSVKRLAMHVEDHPLAYGKFEGIIPKGEYGGGTVMLWDTGEWLSDDENPQQAYVKGNMKFSLRAHKLNGKWKLIRMNNNDKSWLLIKIKDKYAKKTNEYEVTIEEPTSVLSNRSLDEIAKYGNQVSQNKKTTSIKKKNISGIRRKKALLLLELNGKPSRYPMSISPQLATLVESPPEGDAWLHEIKFDGYRIVAFKHKSKTMLMTRNGNNWTKKFKKIADLINNLPIENAIFDGEMVVLDTRQQASFQLLQNSIKKKHDNAFLYYIFDLLYYNKYNLMSLPLIERKIHLEHLFTVVEDNSLRYSDHVVGSGKEVLKKACEMSLEGIVSKKADSSYLECRGTNWLKSKCLKRQEFVIGGFTKPRSSRQGFGSLLIGTFNRNHELIYHGHVGTGFSVDSLQAIYAELIKHKTERMPFLKRPPRSREVTWVVPTLVAEVAFTEWTDSNALRHPSFKGIRSDKSANTIRKESSLSLKKISAMQKESTVKNIIKISHPDKIMYKEDKINKQQLAEYYAQIKDWILPYIINRPLTWVRCPGGYTHCFYQKHLDDQHPVGLYLISIQGKHKKENYFYIIDNSGLTALPQLNVLEIHPWGSCIDQLEYPDMLIFDLDPGPKVAWKKVVSIAFAIKKHLSDFKLLSFVKTTGGKGLHIVVPIKPEYEWSVIKNFTHTFADFIMINYPADIVTKMTKSLRSGKIYLDYLRNQRGATAIAPYSTRARIHAPVSTPIAWEELTADRRDTYFTLQTMLARLNSLKKDPWQDFFKVKQSLNLDIMKLLY